MKVFPCASALSGTVHAFVPPVLFGMAPPDTLRSDAQLYQPDGKAT
jgi:hypothetical protein